MNFGEKATQLSEQREAARVRGDAARVGKLTRDLEQLYTKRRLHAAQAGSIGNDQIIKRARIETELERLMADDRTRQAR